jgi:hypothetical protein
MARGAGYGLSSGSGTVGGNVYAEAATMKQRKKLKYVHEGQYVAEVDVELLEDAYKFDDVRDALRRRDLESAAEYGRIYELRPVAQR